MTHLAVMKGLDEAQSYLLAWRQREDEAFLSCHAFGRVELLIGSYFEERQCILACLDTLLQLRASECSILSFHSLTSPIAAHSVFETLFEILAASLS